MAEERLQRAIETTETNNSLPVVTHSASQMYRAEGFLAEGTSQKPTSLLVLRLTPRFTPRGGGARTDVLCR